MEKEGKLNFNRGWFDEAKYIALHFKYMSQTHLKTLKEYWGRMNKNFNQDKRIMTFEGKVAIFVATMLKTFKEK